MYPAAVTYLEILSGGGLESGPSKGWDVGRECPHPQQEKFGEVRNVLK